MAGSERGQPVSLRESSSPALVQARITLPCAGFTLGQGLIRLRSSDQVPSPTCADPPDDTRLEFKDFKREARTLAEAPRWAKRAGPEDRCSRPEDRCGSREVWASHPADS